RNARPGGERESTPQPGGWPGTRSPIRHTFSAPCAPAASGAVSTAASEVSRKRRRSTLRFFSVGPVGLLLNALPHHVGHTTGRGGGNVVSQLVTRNCKTPLLGHTIPVRIGGILDLEGERLVRLVYDNLAEVGDAALDDGLVFFSGALVAAVGGKFRQIGARDDDHVAAIRGQYQLTLRIVTERRRFLARCVGGRRGNQDPRPGEALRPLRGNVAGDREHDNHQRSGDCSKRPCACHVPLLSGVNATRGHAFVCPLGAPVMFCPSSSLHSSKAISLRSD